MAFISWRSEYEIGVREVDAEHRKLFELINEYYDQHLHGANRKEIERILNSLVSYAEVHFQNEEALMEKCGYPHLGEHRKQHAELFTSIFHITQRLIDSPDKADRETLNFLKKWLRDHIVLEDVEIGYFIKLNAKQADDDSATEAVREVVEEEAQPDAEKAETPAGSK